MVKRKTLNAFFGHSRSSAHPKPYIIIDRRDEFYNPVPFDFGLLKTCHGRDLPEIDGESLILLNDSDVASFKFKIGLASKLRV